MAGDLTPEKIRPLAVRFNLYKSGRSECLRTLLEPLGLKVGEPLLRKGPRGVSGGFSGPKTHFPLGRFSLQRGVGKHLLLVLVDQVRGEIEVPGKVEEMAQPRRDQRA